MLFLLALTAASPRDTTPPATGPADGCGGRTLYDIIWGCLVTIFACVWVSVHPNVPPKPAVAEPSHNSSIWTRVFWKIRHGTLAFRARLQLMLVGILAPELIVGLALRQRAMAKEFSEVFKVSMTHGFFIGMGGFVDINGHPLVSSKQFTGRSLTLWARANYLTNRTFPALGAIQRVPRGALTDKSKGDVYSKAIALSQCLWFVLQCLARAAQHLPLTQLEVITLAFTALNCFTWVLWWDKPLDVSEAIVITYEAARDPWDQDSIESAPTAEPLQASRRARFLRILGFPFGPADDLFRPETAASVPTFWYTVWDDISFTLEGRCLLHEFLIAGLFGAIHCAAWRGRFNSSPEMWLWRGAATALAAIPLAAAALLFVGEDGVSRDMKLTLRMSNAQTTYTRLAAFVLWALLLYIPARLATLVLPLMALRSVEPAAFVDVNWTMYIPHV
ncbi:hypothetical protein MIND_01251800 [Mycena indigotica]|uniref:Uncharacterized protein n=1 Tax=Mycena indigotica TaxID=2126181 RepID=A0A8H6VSI3_9AGAR|nr:uncharacterized protein MIND_01251800 [Mycena indigotica]KAF7292244.1 hypothetical protein MIND_01251800 [Mycena indigotica]